MTMTKPLKNNMTMIKPLKNNMTMIKPLKNNMAMVKQLQKNMTMVKQLKKEHDNGKTAKKHKTTTYRLKFIDSYRFVQCSLSTLVDNLCGNDKKESCNEFTDSMRFMTNSLTQSINKISQASLIEKFPNTYQLCNKDHNKFVLLLRKGVYLYEYMDCWKKFKEESFPDKEFFYSELNNEHITDEDYEHDQKVWSTFNIRN